MFSVFVLFVMGMSMSLSALVHVMGVFWDQRQVCWLVARIFCLVHFLPTTSLCRVASKFTSTSIETDEGTSTLEMVDFTSV